MADQWERERKTETDRFYEDIAGTGVLEGMRQYITRLLPTELAQCEKPKRLKRLSKLPGEKCDVLVLLVGHSFEPLLQAVVAYQPAEVVPVLNRQYGENMSGRQMAHLLGSLLSDLVRHDLVAEAVSLRDCDLLVDDTPSAVFRLLLQELRNCWAKSVVIDITGGKKSMVSGAFFYAAYSNTPISYVDFGEYPKDRGRPYGFTCDIGLIDNPYRDFFLRDWAEVRRLYQKYAFAAAGQLVEGILSEMQCSAFFAEDGEEVVATRRLLAALQVYEAWDNGDFQRAKKLIDGQAEILPSEFLDQGVPWAVTVLGDSWPYASHELEADQAAREILDAHLKLKHGDPDPESSIFAQPELLLAYVEDELAKAGRLVAIKEDYRAGFLRAVALDEYLLRARLALLWLNGRLVCKDDGRPVRRSDRSDDWWTRWFTELARCTRISQMRKTLCHAQRRSDDPQYLPLSYKRDQVSDEIRLVVEDDWENRLEPYWQGKQFGDDLVQWNRNREETTLVKLRGEAIHTHLYVTEKIAQAAVLLAQESVAEFRGRWLDRFHPGLVPDPAIIRTSIADWHALCRWSRVDFLPPYRVPV